MDKPTKKRLIRLIVPVCFIVLFSFLQQQGLLTKTVKNTEGVIQESTPGLYRVVRISDGDTIVVDIEEKEEAVRLIGVDTPETKDPRKPVQCFGKAASAYTRNLIGEQEIRLETDSTNANRDRYQRLLRYVYLTDGTLVNKKIIEDGYGFVLTGYPFTKLEEFRAAQVVARENSRGLWSACEIDTSNNREQTKAE